MGRKPRFGESQDEVVFEVCDRFIRRNQKADEIRDALREREAEISREEIYRFLRKGLDQDFFRLCPPTRQILAQRLTEAYQAPPGRIQVVAVRGRTANEHVAAKGAEIVLDLIKRLGERKKKVHLALGAGWTTMLVARHLARLTREERPAPDIVLHALSSAVDPQDPMRSPVAFFTFFQDVGRVKFVGLFSPSGVEVGHYEQIIKLPGIKEPFAQRSSIDIVVTSLGDPYHTDGSLYRFLKIGPAEALEDLRKAGVVGEVQAMPYSKEGPAAMRRGYRAVTLFEIPELVAMAKRSGKYVVLVAAPCGRCGELKTDALRPLCKAAPLRIWTHALLDIAHAELLAALDAPEAPPSPGQ
jgi:DNA-binding transcriptional regulator LsrR (DeoR family)